MKRCFRTLLLTGFDQTKPKVGMALGNVILQGQRGLEVTNHPIDVALRSEHQPQILMGIGLIRRKRNRLPIGGFRLFQLSEDAECVSEIELCRSVLRIDGNGPRETIASSLVLSEPSVDITESGNRTNVFGLNAKRRLEQGLRLGRLVEPKFGGTGHTQGFRVVRQMPRGLQGETTGFVNLAGPTQHFGQVAQCKRVIARIDLIRQALGDSMKPVRSP